jgi:hypothetical protein
MPSPRQIARLWAAAREISLDRDGVYALVHQASGGDSITALSHEQYDAVIAGLVRLGAQPSGGDGRAAAAPRRKASGRKRAPNETALIRPGQRALIEQLRQQLGGRFVGDDKYFAGVCRKAIHVDAPRTAAEAAKLIEGLKRRRGYEQRMRAEGRAR